MRVLLLHGRRTAYGAVRRLRGWADHVVVADHAVTPLARSSLVDSFHVIPDISRSDPGAVVSAIRAIVTAGDGVPKVILCAKDDYLQLLASARDELGSMARFGHEVRPRVLELVLDKASLPTLGEMAGVDVPVTIVDRLDVIEDLRPPLIVKPAMKRLVGLDVERSAFRLRVCQTVECARAAADELRALAVPFVVQEVVGGHESQLHTVGLVARDGKIVAAATAVKVRQFPPRFGECSLGITTDRPDLVELSARLVRASSLSGIAQVEFLEDDNGQYLIEINPRLWSWHEIHASAGTDLVRIAVNEALRVDAANSPFDPAADLAADVHRVGVRWQFAAMDLLHNAGRSVPVRRVLADVRTADVEAFWTRGDPAVARAHWRETLRNLPQLARSTVHRQH